MPLVFDVSNDSCATGFTPDRNTIRGSAREATVQVVVDVVDNRRVESVEMWMNAVNALVQAQGRFGGLAVESRGGRMLAA